MTVTPPQKKRGSEARAARRVVLVVLLVVPALVALAFGVCRAWQFGHPDGGTFQQNHDAGNLTAWQSRTEANQILRDTAAAAGLDVHLWEGYGWRSCKRANGKYDGTSYSLDSLTHDGPLDSAVVVEAVVTYWQHLGLKTDPSVTRGPGSSTQDIDLWAMTSSGAWLEVGIGTGATTFIGESGCALVGGGPTPLPSATLLAVSSGVPVPGSSTP